MLLSLAHQFNERLNKIKEQNPLEGEGWYPWDTLGGIGVLDEFLNGDPTALRAMIGGDPALDVGAGDGCIAFFLESLGAQVDAVDHEQANYNALAGIRTLKRLHGSRVGVHQVDMDKRPNLPRAHYGFTVMLGVLYHLKNPFLVLETLARHSRYLFLSTRIASLSPDRTIEFAGLPLAYLVDEDEINRDLTNYWMFSEEGLKRMVKRSGWNIRNYTTLGPAPQCADPVTADGDVRAYLLAESRFAPAPAGELHLKAGWHELEYDTWRWTGSRFSLVLDMAGPLAPATLHFVFHLLQESMEERPEVTIGATVNGTALAPKTFSTPGEQEYSGTLPAVPAGPVKVEFEVGPPLHHEGDQRQLGVIVRFSGAQPVLLG